MKREVQKMEVVSYKMSRTDVRAALFDWLQSNGAYPNTDADVQVFHDGTANVVSRFYEKSAEPPSVGAVDPVVSNSLEGPRASEDLKIAGEGR